MNYAKAFREIREESGQSRQEMAQKLGVTATALWKIENGKVTPKLKTIKKFCETTVTPLAFFFNRAFTIEDFRVNPNGLMLDGTPVYNDGNGRIFPV